MTYRAEYAEADQEVSWILKTWGILSCFSKQPVLSVYWYSKNSQLNLICDLVLHGCCIPFTCVILPAIAVFISKQDTSPKETKVTLISKPTFPGKLTPQYFH